MAQLGEHDFEDAYPDGVERHYWNVARNAVVYDAMGSLPAGDAVIDVGCGRGIFVDYLRRRNVDAWGVDLAAPRPLHDSIAPYLMLGRDVADVGAELANRVACVLLLDVLEHVDDPRSFLAMVLARFPHAGKLVVTLPARQELWTNYDAEFGHRRRYDRRGARSILEAVDATDIRVRYFFHALYPAILATTRLGGRSGQIAAPSGALRRAAHSVVAYGLKLESNLLPGWLPGASLIATARLSSTKDTAR